MSGVGSFDLKKGHETDDVFLDSSHRERRERTRSRSRERVRDNARRDDRSRSRSPRKEPRRSEEPERPRSSRFDNEFTKSRTSTPPVSFNLSTPQAFDEDHMDLDHNTQKGAKNIKVKRDKPPVREESSDEEVVVEEGDMGDMAAMMGFGGFGTTQNKKVAGNDIGGVRKEKKTEYRQYMNRVGGFNRPLSPPK